MVARLENNSFSDQLQKWVMRERPYKTCVALKDTGSCKINKKIAKKKKSISDAICSIDRIIYFYN